MDKKDVLNFQSQLRNKPIIAEGDTFKMFGVEYIAKKASDNQCDGCAFREANCIFNVDIPNCNNGVCFKVLKIS